jgi:hypothetical protein
MNSALKRLYQALIVETTTTILDHYIRTAVFYTAKACIFMHTSRMACNRRQTISYKKIMSSHPIHVRSYAVNEGRELARIAATWARGAPVLIHFSPGAKKARSPGPCLKLDSKRPPEVRFVLYRQVLGQSSRRNSRLVCNRLFK